ncbi:NTP transferase domain-containing protein [Roseibacillus ishigakijimensis]|uniref:Probable molybdenum cofactor guanylyltransferase n=1 Tax=Roseibacillus ishigakijimensis TaxID=454146 RepID=A0A934RUX8_9BACT|nr:NTP transferase domain-containing protein [Roseibacillus ishigakijimensis]MBK1834630.1 NTP transferase domain-containing protein [Roseibacillus ishigakijimensis]
MSLAFPIKALVLVGGKSRRMGQDKAQLEFEGKTLLERLLAVLAPRVPEIFLSVAQEEQRSFQRPVIRDLTSNPGPLGGLEAAFAHDPKSAWLVLACDLPLFDDPTLAALLAHADASAMASCFLSRLDGRPEPLCTLYQPEAGVKLTEYLAQGGRCARKFLESLKPQGLALPNPLALDNANRPEHLHELTLLAREGLVRKEATITYYGKLSSEAPAAEEIVQTQAATCAGLYEEVRLRHRLSLDLDTVKPVLADEFVDWTTPLPPGAQVAFLPPFAGG